MYNVCDFRVAQCLPAELNKLLLRMEVMGLLASTRAQLSIVCLHDSVPILYVLCRAVYVSMYVCMFCVCVCVCVCMCCTMS